MANSTRRWTGFEAVADIRERAAHDHAHGVIEVALRISSSRFTGMISFASSAILRSDFQRYSRPADVRQRLRGTFNHTERGLSTHLSGARKPLSNQAASGLDTGPNTAPFSARRALDHARSVTSASISSAGVTSNTGLKARTAVGHRPDARHGQQFAPSRSSIWMSLAVGRGHVHVEPAPPPSP
jgi:hypothetical protein